MLKKSICLGVLVLVTACSKQGSEVAQVQVPAPVTTQEAAAPEPPELNLPWASLNEAIASTRLEMTDIREDEISDGAAKLAIWSAEHMQWSQLQEVAATKHALVMKDSQAHRGYRLCAQGSVIEIAVDRSVPGLTIHQGGLYDGSGRIYRFVALKSTGDIVADSRARFCGVVTGQHHYANSMGGVAHAVHLVGMFDLPENR